MKEFGEESFLNNYELEEPYLIEADQSSGQPNLISADKGGEPYLIKFWPRSPDTNDEDLEDIWLHELRQLHRLKGYPGTGDYISSLIESGRDAHGFYLVLDTNGRLPLTYILKKTATLSLRPHWLKRLKSSNIRMQFWENIIRIVKAIELLHAQGLLHRHLDANSILTKASGYEDSVDFQLTGFEWSIRVPTLKTARTEITNYAGNETFYSFATDWADLGFLIADLLEIKADIVDDLSQPISNLVTNTGLMLSEINLIRALTGKTFIQANIPQSALNGRLIEATAKSIIDSLNSITTRRHAIYDLAISLNSESKSTKAPFPVFVAVQKKYKEKHGVTLTSNDSEEVLKFIRQDLSDNPTLLLTLAPNKTEKRILIKGKELIYQIDPFLADKRTSEFTWDIGECQRAYLEPAHWMYKENCSSTIKSEQIKTYTIPEARQLYRNSPGSLSQTSWSAILRQFEEITDSKSPEQKTLIKGLAACHLTEIAYARADIFPVEVVDRYTSEDGTWLIKLSSINSIDAETLAKSMGLEPPAVRLENKLIKNLGEFEAVTWSLISNSLLTREEEGETLITFQEYETNNEDQLIFIFNCKTPPPYFKQYFIAPDSLQGTFRQLSRRASSLDKLETHAELMNVLIHPQQRIITTQDKLPENDTFNNLDTSKQDAFKKILRTLPIYLVQGPPGVGKTHLITALIKQIFEQEPDSRILLTAQSHSTVQHLFHEIEKTGVINGEGPETNLLVIQCNKQDKDDDTEVSDADIKAKNYLKKLIDSPLFKKSKSQNTKNTITSMMHGAKSKRYPLINQLLRSANMVFSTTNAEPVERMIRDKAQFDWTIMEETGKVTGIELLSPLLLSHRRLMIGDHKQLPPYRSTEIKAILSDAEKLRVVFKETEQISNSKIKGETIKAMLDEETLTTDAFRDIGISATRNLMLFETLINDEEAESKNHKKIFGSLENRKAIASMLTVQHRMHPDIAELISHVFYKKELTTDEGKIRHYLQTPNPRPFFFASPKPLTNSAAITWIDMPDVQTTKNMKEGDSLPRWQNKLECSAVVDLLKKLRKHPNVEQKPKLAVLSPYAEQVSQLAKALTRKNPDSKYLSNLDLFTPPDDHSSFCSTVDGFQGSEADLIIVSLVRNNDKGSLRSALGFLVDERRMNVLLSRARYQLIIIGSYQFIKEWAGQIEKAPSFSGYQDGEFLAKLFSKLESYRQQEKLTLLPWTELSPSTQINQKKPNSNRKRNPIQVNKPNNLSARNNNGDKK